MIKIIKDLTIQTGNPAIVVFKGAAGHLKVEVSAVQYVSNGAANGFVPDVFINGVKSAGGYFRVDGPTDIEFRVPNVQWSPIPQGNYVVPDFGITYVIDDKELFQY